MSKKETVIREYGPFVFVKSSSTYSYHYMYDTRTNKRLFTTYRVNKIKDIDKFIENKIRAKLKTLDKALNRVFKDIEKTQNDQVLWEEFLQNVENPPPLSLDKIFEKKDT